MRWDLPHRFELAIAGDVPLGSGLSSSASLEVAPVLALTRLYRIDLAGLELGRLCHRAESGFVGTNCGIMDQYVIYFSRAGNALLLGTKRLSHTYVPMELPGVSLLVVDSSGRRELSGSGYNLRRRECQETLSWLRKRFPNRGLATLGDLGEEDILPLKGEMPARLWRRASELPVLHPATLSHQPKVGHYSSSNVPAELHSASFIVSESHGSSPSVILQSLEVFSLPTARLGCSAQGTGASPPLPPRRRPLPPSSVASPPWSAVPVGL